MFQISNSIKNKVSNTLDAVIAVLPTNKDLRPVQVSTPGEETFTYFIDFDNDIGEDLMQVQCNQLGIRDPQFILGLRFKDNDGDLQYLESSELINDWKVSEKGTEPMKFQLRAVALPETVEEMTKEWRMMRLIYYQTKSDLVAEDKFDLLECPDPKVRQQLDALAYQIDNNIILQADGMKRFLKIASQLKNFGVEYFAAILKSDFYTDYIPKDRRGKPCVFGIDSKSITMFNPLKKNKQEPFITIPWSDVMSFENQGNEFQITTLPIKDAVGVLLDYPKEYDLILPSKGKSRLINRLVLRNQNLRIKMQRNRPSPLDIQLKQDTDRRCKEPQVWYDRCQQLIKLNSSAKECIDAYDAMLQLNPPVLLWGRHQLYLFIAYQNYKLFIQYFMFCPLYV